MVRWVSAMAALSTLVVTVAAGGCSSDDRPESALASLLTVDDVPGGFLVGNGPVGGSVGTWPVEAGRRDVGSVPVLAGVSEDCTAIEPSFVTAQEAAGVDFVDAGDRRLSQTEFRFETDEDARAVVESRELGYEAVAACGAGMVLAPTAELDDGGWTLTSSPIAQILPCELGDRCVAHVDTGNCRGSLADERGTWCSERVTLLVVEGRAVSEFTLQDNPDDPQPMLLERLLAIVQLP